MTEALPAPETVTSLAADLVRRAPLDAAALLEKTDTALASEALARLPSTFVQQVLQRLSPAQRETLSAAVAQSSDDHYRLYLSYPEETVGRLMTEPLCVFGPDTPVSAAIDQIRRDSEHRLVTYAFVTDTAQRLLGVVVMRELMLARPDQRLQEIMIAKPFAFQPDTEIEEAMRAVVHRHYPVYPVCDAEGRLLGLVQGYRLFEEHGFNLTAQAGRMVGASQEEHYSTPWWLCFKWRHPWLQLNLVTAFLAAAVVGGFEATIAQVVALAVFLPVLAGQSGNTGVQALAVTVRGLTLNEYGHEAMGRLLLKEGLLGIGNGALVGVIAAAAMWFYADATQAPNAIMLAVTVFVAMIGSCFVSGLSGVIVPLMLKRVGADPASASGIFVTTCTDIASLGMFLGVATLLVL